MHASMTRGLVALRWPVGVLLTAWSYVWRTTPVHRREVEGDRDDLPPPLPAGTDDSHVQHWEDGAGTFLRRRYRVRVRDARLGAVPLIERVAADPNLVVPGELAHFHKDAGIEHLLRPGDRFTVRMPGPWDGPVMVVEVTPSSFRFATLDGHLEAGQIEWRAEDEPDGTLRFEIESRSRPGDRLSHLMHHRLRMAKEVQLHMWTSVHERVARLCAGRLTGGIDIETRSVEG